MVEDRTRRRADLVAAVVAGVALAVVNAVVARMSDGAFRAGGEVTVLLLEKILEAGCIVWEALVESIDRVARSFHTLNSSSSVP